MAANKHELKGKILLVDDDPGLLRLLSIRLRAEGYDIEAVESAEAALGVVGRHCHGARHDPRCGCRDAGRRVRLFNEADR